jgi:hypothetical protein
VTTEKEVGRLVAAMMPLFANYRMPASPEDAQVLYRSWHMMVGHLDTDVLAAAFRVAAGKSEFFPTPALVLDCAVALTVAPKRSGTDAWGDVQAAIRKHGFYHPPGGASVLAVGGYEWHFDDVLAGEIVAALGWGYLCMSEDEMADRAHFIKAYEQKRDRAYADARLTPELLDFQAHRRAALAEPDSRAAAAKQLMAGIGQKGTR